MKKVGIFILAGLLLLSGCGTDVSKKDSKGGTVVGQAESSAASGVESTKELVSEEKMEEIMENTYQQMSMDEAKEWMEQETDYILLDVRTQEEYAQGHIPNAINIPNETIANEDLAQLPDKAQKILVYCRSGNRSRQAAEKLVKLGYTDIVEIGGINSWQGDIIKE